MAEPTFALPAKHITVEAREASEDGAQFGTRGVPRSLVAGTGPRSLLCDQQTSTLPGRGEGGGLRIGGAGLRS